MKVSVQEIGTAFVPGGDIGILCIGALTRDPAAAVVGLSDPASIRQKDQGRQFLGFGDLQAVRFVEARIACITVGQHAVDRQRTKTSTRF